MTASDVPKSSQHAAARYGSSEDREFIDRDTKHPRSSRTCLYHDSSPGTAVTRGDHFVAKRFFSQSVPR
jgi:hypothetical protein